MKTLTKFIIEDAEYTQKKMKVLYNMHMISITKLLKKYGFEFKSKTKNIGDTIISFVNGNDEISLGCWTETNNFVCYCYDKKNITSIHPHIFYNDTKKLSGKGKYINWDNVIDDIPKMYEKNIADLEQYLKKNYS